ncbi:putative polyketide synthase [Hypoxylon sp. FL0543]|nr:putative polyketide synthase [Hypoxylon sp. FL0543]
MTLQSLSKEFPAEGLAPGSSPPTDGATQRSLGQNGHSSLHSAIPSDEVDENELDPIVICGLSIKFPQDATSPEAFWRMMVEKRCATTEFPPDRISTAGFYKPKKSANTLPLRGGHFISENPAAFDADFFSISPAEAAAMDPMQRWLLEVAFMALENAGIPMEQVAGTSTAVYTGSFNTDYMLQLNRDPECLPTYAAVGSGLSMLANRISWFFNLRGPSIGLDSACSSTAMATDIACQALRTKSCNMALVAGCNVATSPEPFVWMSNLNFLSPDSRCHSFDHRGNGYARGEGIGVLVLKRLSDAIRDGNTIRAVIRSTGSNEDGRTPGITQPSRAAQVQLIKETYEKAGLSMRYTRYFEAHGTGTAVGDPIEAQAIGTAFQRYRSVQDPLYVGSAKSNIGHLEGASGLAAIVKAVLVLEKGVIPPNANFEKRNSKIDEEFLRIKFPETTIPWPTSGLRRVSINSFGFGGANSHVILDDAYNYLRLHSLSARHCTIPFPPGSTLMPVQTNGFHLGLNGTTTNGKTSNGTSALNVSTPNGTAPNGAALDGTARNCTTTNGTTTNSSKLNGTTPKEDSPKLLVWSAADKGGIDRISHLYEEYFHVENKCTQDPKFLGNLAFTLNMHRSHLPWRSFAVLKSTAELHSLGSQLSPPTRVPTKAPLLGFVFNGQGAQWHAMGRELMSYSSFQGDLDSADRYLRGLGCCWSVTEELLKDKHDSKINDPELSQTLCTVLQVALVNLLRRFGVKPSSVVGHSSGEIAAAYAGGYITPESAWKLAYFRGILSAKLAQHTRAQTPGSMMSIGVPEDRARELIASMGLGTSFGLSVACVNSPNNVTVSGEDHLIEQLKTRLEDEKVFARKLRVPLAYHSRQMEEISSSYIKMVDALSAPPGATDRIPMISSVTGKRIEKKRLLDPSYWALNMVSTVQFVEAVTAMCAQSSTSLVKKIDKSHTHASVVDHLLEVGPHNVLQGPLRDILRGIPRGGSIGYSSTLKRDQPATDTMLRAVGELHCMGVPVDFNAINEPSEERTHHSLLVNLPEYPFDHSHHYWHESRLSRNYRLRDYAPSELLGVRARDWNPAEARWRHFIRLAEVPWVEQHVVNGKVLYPGAGMLVMAIEAAKQLAGKESQNIKGYALRDVQIEAPIDLTANGDSLEVQTTLKEVQGSTQRGTSFDFTIRTYAKDAWLVNCAGIITVESSGADEDDWCRMKTVAQQQLAIKELLDQSSQCKTPVESQHMYRFLKQHGLDYGPVFQAAHNQHHNETGTGATAQVKLFDSADDDHVIHPVSLDAIMHLALTALTSGGSKPMATSIPTRFGTLWVSSQGLNWPAREVVNASSSINHTTRHGFTCSGVAMDGGDMRLWYEGLEMTNVTATPASFSLPNPRQYCMNVQCKFALNKLSYKETLAVLEGIRPENPSLSGFYRDVEGLVEMTLERLMTGSIDPTTFDTHEPWKAYFWKWAKYHLTTRRERKGASNVQCQIQEANSTFEELSDRLGKSNRVGRVYAEVALNLEAMMKGEANPLEVLLRSGFLKGYYEELIGYGGGVQVAAYMDLLAHQTPGMRILEVGGGTASATRNFVHALRSQPDSAETALRCARYDFTDISAAFLDGARNEFAAFRAQMTFGTLDMARDFAAQGNQCNYDVLVADNVLHVTADLAGALRNARKALKPGGKLLLHEFLTPSGWTTGFIFGVFPGWWLGAEADNRPLSPNITPQAWDTLLKENGFSGVDMVFEDLGNDVSHQLGWLVSTATDDTPPLTVQPRIIQRTTVIINEASERQTSLAQELVPALSQTLGLESRVLSLEAACTAKLKRSTDELVIMLIDFGESFIANLDEGTWNQLKATVKATRHLLWISAGGGRGAAPEHGMLDGLARTLRSEFYELHLVTLALELIASSGNKVHPLMQIVQEMLDTVPGRTYEQEYLEYDGYLHTRRLVESRYLKSSMDTKLTPYEIVPTSVGSGVQFGVSIAPPGDELSAYYVQLPMLSPETIERDSVDVNVKAVLLQPPNRTFVPGEGSDIFEGTFCAGIVNHVGPDSPFRPGDRVVVASPKSFRSHLRVASNTVARMPPSLSFSDACQIVPAMVSAHHAVVELGRVEGNRSILVHDGASVAGQACLKLLTDLAERNIWATASNEEDSRWIIDTYQIPSEQVLPKSWFADRPMLVSPLKRKFDSVLLPSSDIDTPLLKDTLKPGGQYIIFQTATTGSSNSQRGACVPKSATSNIIDLRKLLQEPGRISSRSLRYPANEPLLQSPRCVASQLPASKLDEACSSLRSARDDELLVINLDDSDVIDIRMKRQPTYQLNPCATYLISGGLGGLGRSMARWLVGRGARYLILLSRSGPRTPEARDLLSEFEKMGIQVEAPPCDVSDRSALQSVLADCSRKMPPVKGCIQASAVLTELVYENMTFQDWRAAIKPKVAASRNLHLELPRGLDFFIMLSSMMGILGSGSLAAYNAGNTYQDALAAHRMSLGERTISLDLGAVVDVGHLVTHSYHLDRMERARKFEFVYVEELCALLDIFCDPKAAARSSPHEITAQALVGIRPVAHWMGAGDVPATMQQPFWGHTHHVPTLDGTDEKEDNGTRRKDTLDVGSRLATAGTRAEAAEIVCQALIERISVLLGFPKERLDAQKPMHAYGLDSLSAIELRNWVGKVFDVDMPIFEILGGATFATASTSIAQKIKL